MGRPRPNPADSSYAADSSYNAAEVEAPQTQPYPPTAAETAGYPPAAPYPPTAAPYPPAATATAGYSPAAPYPPPSRPPPPVANGTPVSFPSQGNHAQATTPKHNLGTASPYMHNIGDPWSSGIHDCGQNPTNAIMTAFFPCVTFGQIAEILDEGETSCTIGSFMYILMVPALLTCWILGSNYRQKLRMKYNLVQAPSEDWTVHLFCSCCALCQEYRELERHGIDPSLGWMGYLAQQQGASTIPPTNQFMGR